MQRKQKTLPEKTSKGFLNPHVKEVRRKIRDVFLWKMGYYDDLSDSRSVPQDFVFPFLQKTFDPKQPSAVWINHSTFLLRVHGKTFLTDPIWSDRCSPFRLLGPKRRHRPAIEIEDLGQVDFVCISHNHYDHLDKKTVRRLFSLYPHITWFVPYGVKQWFVKQGITQVQEFSWWEEKRFSFDSGKDHEISISAVPSQHFSGRSLWDFNQTLWVGWVVESRKQQSCKRFYFVGDTGYNTQDFVDIGHKWNAMDLSMIPIGSYVPRRFMAPVHIDPADAVKIHKEVGSKLSIGMHWKTFPLSDEATYRPPYDLYETLLKERIDPSTFLAIEPGNEINW